MGFSGLCLEAGVGVEVVGGFFDAVDGRLVGFVAVLGFALQVNAHAFGVGLGGLDDLLADLFEGAGVEEGGVDSGGWQVFAGALQDEDARLDVCVEGAFREGVAGEEAVLAAEAREMALVVEVVVEEVLWRDDGEEAAGL